MKTRNLTQWLEAVSVYEVDDDRNDAHHGALTCLMKWYGVSVGRSGTIAYFRDEKDALRFRLDYINTAMNVKNL